MAGNRRMTPLASKKATLVSMLEHPALLLPEERISSLRTKIQEEDNEEQIDELLSFFTGVIKERQKVLDSLT